jgi:hypothetical protein
VSGADKAEIIYTVLAGTAEPPLPAQLVRLPDGERIFLCDEAAAKLVLDEIAAKGEFTGKKDAVGAGKKVKGKH